MIKSIKVTNHLGEFIVMELRSPEKSGFFVRSIEGLGPSKSNINMSESLSADGSFYNSSKITSRNIVLNLGFYNDGTESIESIRQKTYRFFPMKKNLSIEVETDNRLGVTTGYAESNEPDIFSKDSGTVISLLCPSAFFYGKDIVQTLFTGTNSLFEFPWENPSLTLPLIEFGSIFINTAASVFYTGDEETGITIYISVLGAVNNLTIFNTTTGQLMAINSTKLIALTGANLQAGDFIVISTLRGSKTITLIRAGVAINILNTLDTGASWFRLQRGDNVFTYTAASGLTNLQFLIEHRIVYGGL